MEIPNESVIEFEDPELEEVINHLEKWGEEHGLIFKLVAQIGFGRDCVTFAPKDHPDGCVAYNPLNYKTLEYISDVYDDRLQALPAGVSDAYHKDNYLCVLRYDGEGNGEVEIEGFKKALEQLKIWTDYLDSLGRVEVVPYTTGLRGFEAIFVGETGYTLKLVEG